MATPRWSIAACAVFALQAAPASGLALEDCTRVVRGWNGWEVQHRDLGGGRVAFAERWTAEGVYLDLLVTDCASGETVRSRVREEMMKPRPAFNRTTRGIAVIDRHARRAPALFDIEGLAAELSKIGEDTTVRNQSEETCACAALYPDLRGDKTAFEGI